PVSSIGFEMSFSLGALEFERLKNLLKRYVSTDYAGELLIGMVPSIDVASLEADHSLVSEAMAYLREHRVPFREIAFLGPAIEKIVVAGAALDIAEIEAVQDFLAQVEGLRARWKDDAEAFPKLAQKAARLPDLRELHK